jgi:PAS domain S-box-containing protein
MSVSQHEHAPYRRGAPPPGGARTGRISRALVKRKRDGSRSLLGRAHRPLSLMPSFGRQRVLDVQRTGDAQAGPHRELGPASSLAGGVEDTARPVSSEAQGASRREVQRALLAFADSSEAGIRIFSSDMARLVYVSPSFATLAGCSREQLRLHPRAWLACVHPDDRPLAEEAMRKSVEGPRVVEYRVSRAKEPRTWVRDRWRSVGGGSEGPEFIVAVAEDITLRRARVDEALRESEARLRAARVRLQSAMDAAAIATWSWEAATDRTMGDERMAALFGIPPEEAAAGVPRARFMAAIHDEDRAAVEARVREAMAGDGHYRAEYRVRAPGGSYRWVQAHGRVDRDASGRPLAVLGALVDVTRQKEAEARRRDAEERLRAALEVKDEFLGLVSHELGTPMTLILGMSRILARERVHPAQAREMVADIADSAEVLNGLVGSILTLSRLDHDEAGRLREPVLLHHTATRVLERHRQRDLSRTYELEVRSTGSLVEVHEAWLERVIDDLVGNAAKYSDPGQPVRIDIDAGDDEVRLRVLDEGNGLPEEAIERVFEPFYRAPGSESRAPGVGLGLAVSKRIIELLGGRIWVRRRESGGSEFGFSLPALHEAED